MASNDVFISTRASKNPLTNYHFYLTPKESLYLKINGFGSDGQHLVLGTSQKAMDKNKKGCSEAYKKVVEELSKIDWDKYIEEQLLKNKHIKKLLSGGG
ncbi:TPA: hypothetical protein H2W70_004115 [Salmonella enterica]|nr:hypothetical protein [Salmonella enterica]HAK8195216.1 hypothetical protein [Salmonella enterica]HAK8434564.1 hypothetical protein [Salmonella enterica]HAK8462312.1 hypothetical protein [Salmonella enterica]